jgi:TfoX/Sxy family transcriptional regulator of competence genes
VGKTEDEIRDLAGDVLAEIAGLDVRRMFSGWGFYCRGLLFAAAWDGEFRFRSRQEGRWIYEAVDPELLRNPDLLLSAARDVLAKLEVEPLARPRKRRQRN